MFDNIGGKIKSIAKTVCYIGMIGFIIFGLVLFFSEAYLVGIFVAFFGTCLCYLLSYINYGFGQLIENTDRIVKALSHNENQQIVKDQLKSWLESGLITQEEYEQKVGAAK